jgi:hypothetical protein
MGESSPATGPPQRHLCFGEQRDHHLLHFFKLRVSAKIVAKDIFSIYR